MEKTIKQLLEESGQLVEKKEFIDPIQSMSTQYCDGFNKARDLIYSKEVDVLEELDVAKVNECINNTGAWQSLKQYANSRVLDKVKNYIVGHICKTFGTKRENPLLELATTRELLAEITARIETDGNLDYKTVGGNEEV